MTDRTPQYQALIERAAPLYEEFGVIDLVYLSEADELGVSTETFTRDVAVQAHANSFEVGQ